MIFFDFRVPCAFKQYIKFERNYKNKKLNFAFDVATFAENITVRLNCQHPLF